MQKSKKFLLFIFFTIMAIVDFNVLADHTCALTNENLVKFRKKIVGGHPQQAREFCKDFKSDAATNMKFDWPVDNCNFWISSLYGPRKIKGVVRQHKGVDLAAISGTQVKAAAPGKIIRAEFDPGYGNVVEILHRQGMVTRYGHMQDFAVEVGDKVARAEMIGSVGATGHVRGKKDPSHLHFEIIDKHGKQVDPSPHLFCGELE